MNEISNFTPELSAIHQWGIEFIRAVQSIASPPLTEFLKIFTDLSTYGVFALIWLVFIWCIDYKKGLYLGYLLSFGMGLLEGLKVFLQIPRPFAHFPELMLKKAADFSTPSGHSFASAMMYPAIMFYEKKTKLPNSIRYVIVFAMPLLVGFSRIYLGVHYPTDVLLGWALGAIAVIIFIKLTPIIDKKISDIAGYTTFSTGYESIETSEAVSDNQNGKTMSKTINGKRNFKSLKFGVAAIFSFIIIIVCEEKPYLSGLLLGLAFGNIHILEPSKIKFDASSGSTVKKIIRFFLGLILTLLPIAIYTLLGINESYTQFKLYNFLAFAIAGVIASGYAPILFCKLNLCGEEKNTGEQ